MLSKIKPIGNVLFPEFTGERLYQIPFYKNKALPTQFKRWQKTIDAMLVGVDTEDEMYLTVDQSSVKKGCTQRRAGVHIDGNWIADGKEARWDTGPGWNTRNLDTGGIILATNCIGTKVYAGEFVGEIGEGGDCSHIDLSNTKQYILKDNVAYIGNVTLLHEAMPATKECNRTLVRITLPQSYAA